MSQILFGVILSPEWRNVNIFGRMEERQHCGEMMSLAYRLRGCSVHRVLTKGLWLCMVIVLLNCIHWYM